MEWIFRLLISATIGAVINAVTRRAINRKSKMKVKNEYHSHYHYEDSRSTPKGNKCTNYLESSICFFREGVELLRQFRIEMNNNRGRGMAQTQEDGNDRLTTDAVLSGFFATSEVEKIKEDIEEMKSISEERSRWVKSCFRSAREDATRAFNDATLSTKDRIIATTLRVSSAILGNLEDPAAVAVVCKVYLEQLHALPDISRHFRRYFENGTRIQTDILNLVVLINYTVFYFSQNLANGNTDNWPRVEIFDNHRLHPSLNLQISQEILKKEISSLYHGPEFVAFDKDLTDPVAMAVNSQGQFIIADFGGPNPTMGGTVKVFNSNGAFQFAISLAKDESQEMVYLPRSVSTDGDDNIYVHAKIKCQDAVSSEASGVLFAIDKDGKATRQITTECGDFIAIHKTTNRIAFSCKNGISLHEMDERLTCINVRDLEQNTASPGPLLFTDKGEIILTDTTAPYIRIITDTTIRQFEVCGAGGWKYIAFNNMSDEIIVSYLSKNLTNFQLQSYSRSGRPLGSVHLPETYSSHPRAVTITAKGRIAVLYEKRVHLI